MVSLFENLEPSALRFHSGQDALDYAAKLREDCENWLTVNERDFVKRYKKCEIEIVVALRTRPEFENYHLIFRSIPDRRIGNTDKPPTLSAGPVADESLADGNHDFMLVGNRYLVECPEKVIPSFVRLEPAKKRVDWLRNILGPSEGIWHLSESSCERERGVLRLLNARRDRDGIPGIIEGAAETAHDVGGCVRDDWWEFFSHLDLENKVPRFVRMRLSHSFVRLFLAEGFDLPFEIGEMFLSPCELLP